MIIRIMGEGRYEVPGSVPEQLVYLDGRLRCAIDEGDSPMFAAALNHLLTEIRGRGTAMPDECSGASEELLLPAAGSPMEVVATALGGRRLIPL
jgi:hypothetical protein